MCTILALTKFSQAFNYAYTSIIDKYCSAAIMLFNPTKQRTVIVPFRVSLRELFGEFAAVESDAHYSNSDNDSLSIDSQFDMEETEYRAVNVLNIDPEVYYFFKFYPNKISAFEELLTSCSIPFKESYVMDDVDSDNRLELIFNEDDNRVYVKYMVVAPISHATVLPVYHA